MHRNAMKTAAYCSFALAKRAGTRVVPQRQRLLQFRMAPRSIPQVIATSDPKSPMPQNMTIVFRVSTSTFQPDTREIILASAAISDLRQISETLDGVAACLL